MRKDGLVADGDLTVDEVIADLVLACLLLQRDVLLVELVGVGGSWQTRLTVHLAVVKDLAGLLIQEQRELLAWVTNRVGIRYLSKDLGENVGGTFTVARALLLLGEVHVNCVF